MKYIHFPAYVTPEFTRQYSDCVNEDEDLLCGRIVVAYDNSSEMPLYKNQIVGTLCEVRNYEDGKQRYIVRFMSDPSITAIYDNARTLNVSQCPEVFWRDLGHILTGRLVGIRRVVTEFQCVVLSNDHLVNGDSVYGNTYLIPADKLAYTCEAEFGIERYSEVQE